jgi:histidinol-phosphatase (PHP family)
LFSQNLHTHTTFDDGQNTMEEMALAASKAGLTSIGFSVHVPMPYPACWTIDPGRLPDYFAEARRVKERLRGTIDVYCGAEWDSYAAISPAGFDYVIGSVHHIPAGNDLPCVDHTAQETGRIIRRYFGGDTEAMAEAYFAQYQALAQVKEVDIVGHFDLLTKFDEERPFFDATSPRYLAAATAAMDALIAAGKIFEINTGAISRGYRTTPYPSETLLRTLHQRGGKITISADSHRVEDIAFSFEQAEALARKCGFTELWMFDGKEFSPQQIGG